MVPRSFPLKPMNTDNMHKIVASNQRCTTRILIYYYPAQPFVQLHVFTSVKD